MRLPVQRRRVLEEHNACALAVQYVSARELSFVYSPRLWLRVPAIRPRACFALLLK